MSNPIKLLKKGETFPFNINNTDFGNEQSNKNNKPWQFQISLPLTIGVENNQTNIYLSIKKIQLNRTFQPWADLVNLNLNNFNTMYTNRQTTYYPLRIAAFLNCDTTSPTAIYKFTPLNTMEFNRNFSKWPMDIGDYVITNIVENGPSFILGSVACWIGNIRNTATDTNATAFTVDTAYYTTAGITPPIWPIPGWFLYVQNNAVVDFGYNIANPTGILPVEDWNLNSNALNFSGQWGLPRGPIGVSQTISGTTLLTNAYNAKMAIITTNIPSWLNRYPGPEPFILYYAKGLTSDILSPQNPPSGASAQQGVWLNGPTGTKWFAIPLNNPSLCSIDYYAGYRTNIVTCDQLEPILINKEQVNLLGYLKINEPKHGNANFFLPNTTNVTPFAGFNLQGGFSAPNGAVISIDENDYTFKEHKLLNNQVSNLNFTFTGEDGISFMPFNPTTVVNIVGEIVCK